MTTVVGPPPDPKEARFLEWMTLFWKQFRAVSSFAVQDAITAYAGGGQANAVLLTGNRCRVTTVGSAGDSVKFPPGLVSNKVLVMNSAAANSMNVFPATGEQINDGGANVQVAHLAGKLALYECWATGKWYRLYGA